MPDTFRVLCTYFDWQTDGHLFVVFTPRLEALIQRYHGLFQLGVFSGDEQPCVEFRVPVTMSELCTVMGSVDHLLSSLVFDMPPVEYADSRDYWTEHGHVVTAITMTPNTYAQVSMLSPLSPRDHRDLHDLLRVRCMKNGFLFELCEWSRNHNGLAISSSTLITYDVLTLPAVPLLRVDVPLPF